MKACRGHEITRVANVQILVDWALAVRAIDTDEGISVGEGSCTALGRSRPHPRVRPHCSARSRGTERHWQGLPSVALGGGAVFQTALSAIDSALWDLEQRLAPWRACWAGRSAAAARLRQSGQGEKRRKGVRGRAQASRRGLRRSSAGRSPSRPRDKLTRDRKAGRDRGAREARERRRIYISAEVPVAAHRGDGDEAPTLRPGWFESRVRRESQGGWQRLQRVYAPDSNGRAAAVALRYRDILEKAAAGSAPDLFTPAASPKSARSPRSPTVLGRSRRTIMAADLHGAAMHSPRHYQFPGAGEDEPQPARDACRRRRSLRGGHLSCPKTGTRRRANPTAADIRPPQPRTNADTLYR